MSDLENMLNNGEFFADTADTSEKRFEQHRKNDQE